MRFIPKQAASALSDLFVATSPAVHGLGSFFSFTPGSSPSTPAFLRAHLWLRREQELTPLDTSDPEIFTG